MQISTTFSATAYAGPSSPGLVLWRVSSGMDGVYPYISRFIQTIYAPPSPSVSDESQFV